jgi:putative nucleotidyltransferase with HDIG domain
MRKRDSKNISEDYAILVVDDDQGIVDSLMVVFKHSGYRIEGATDPVAAVEEIRNNKYDLLVLDFLMNPIHGDEVVRRIREFNRELYILLLTGHKDLAPPLETIRALDIQGYCEKSDRFDQLMLLVESGIKSISQMRTIRKFRDGLNNILEAVPKIYQLQPIDNILEEILSQLIPLVNSEDAFMLVDDTHQLFNVTNRSIFKGTGKYSSNVETFIDMLSPFVIEQIGSARSEKKIVKLDDMLILPLTNEFGDTMGVICVELQMSRTSDEMVALFEIYSKQAASSMSNAFLHSLVNIKNEELSRTYEMLRSRYMDTIEALRLVVDAKDIYTRGHSDRVGYYAVNIGNALALSQEDMEILRIAGIFHDVGKIGTADDILMKNEKLSPEEYTEIKKHPIKGAHILSAVSMFKDVAPIVRCHHERIDGTGYPDRIRGAKIPMLARIIAVADAFDAMMSDRQYRSRLTLKEAKEQLLLGKDTQFDGKIVDTFIKILDRYGEIEKELEWTFLQNIS